MFKRIMLGMEGIPTTQRQGPDLQVSYIKCFRVCFAQDNNKQGFEIKGIANPLGLFEFQSLAAPNVSVRRAAVDEVKRCYFSSPSPIPGHFRLLLSWDGKAKVCTRLDGWKC